MRMKLTDIKNKLPGAVHQQYWFSWPDGEFLVTEAVTKPFYKYLHRPGATLKRWMRMYEVELPPGTQICRYVQRGHKRAWVLYSILEDGTMDKQGSSKGVPPWMVRTERTRDSDGTTRG